MVLMAVQVVAEGHKIIQEVLLVVLQHQDKEIMAEMEILEEQVQVEAVEEQVEQAQTHQVERLEQAVQVAGQPWPQPGRAALHRALQSLGTPLLASMRASTSP